jgi:hypothetical protein
VKDSIDLQPKAVMRILEIYEEAFSGPTPGTSTSFIVRINLTFGIEFPHEDELESLARSAVNTYEEDMARLEAMKEPGLNELSNLCDDAANDLSHVSAQIKVSVLRMVIFFSRSMKWSVACYVSLWRRSRAYR